MKCPKCKFITFDYYDECPRCNKDMSAEKTKLGISSIKAAPPNLLGSLTGDLNDSSVGIKVPESAKESDEGMMLGGEEIYDDGSELDIDIDEKNILESGKDADVDSGDISSSADDIILEIEEGAVEEKEVGEEELGYKEGADQEGVQKEGTERDSEEIELDMEDLDLKLDFEEDEESKE